MVAHFPRPEAALSLFPHTVSSLLFSFPTLFFLSRKEVHLLDPRCSGITLHTHSLSLVCPRSVALKNFRLRIGMNEPHPVLFFLTPTPCFPSHTAHTHSSFVCVRVCCSPDLTSVLPKSLSGFLELAFGSFPSPTVHSVWPRRPKEANNGKCWWYIADTYNEAARI